MEEWQDRTSGGRLLQDETRRSRSTDVDKFEEDFDAVNQARASKNQRLRVFVRTNVSSARILLRWNDAVLVCRIADLDVVSRQQTGELAQERSMNMRRIALQVSLALDHKRRWKRALRHEAKDYKGDLHVGQPLWFWRRGGNAAKRPTSASWPLGVVISNTLATVWIAGERLSTKATLVRRHHWTR